MKNLLKLFTKKKSPLKDSQEKSLNNTKTKPKISSSRIGELGEYKINIQLDQLPAGCKYLSDIMIHNSRSRTGYSQIDHVVIHPYGLFVIETKNYAGNIKGKKEYKYWYINKKFKMYNPIRQNYGHIKALEKILKDYPSLLFISMISFTMRARFQVEPELRKIESNELIVYDVELSEYISRKINRLKATNTNPLVDIDTVERIFNVIKEANITDPTLRDKHVNSIKEITT